jgi:hypothetical protein
VVKRTFSQPCQYTKHQIFLRTREFILVVSYPEVPMGPFYKTEKKAAK